LILSIFVDAGPQSESASKRETGLTKDNKVI